MYVTTVGHVPQRSDQRWNSNIIWLLLRERLVLGHTGRMMLWQICLVFNVPGFWLVIRQDTGLWLVRPLGITSGDKARESRMISSEPGSVQISHPVTDPRILYRTLYSCTVRYRNIIILFCSRQPCQECGCGCFCEQQPGGPAQG